MTYDCGLRRETPLAACLKRRIQSSGPIGIRDYMTACLYDGEHGYYRTRPAIGRGGDFVTAPEISQVFGELIGLWSAVVWQQMGSPARFALIELGPGRGTLMRDALRATRRVPGFHAAATVVLVETSETLEREQRRTLADLSVAIRWLRAADIRSSADLGRLPTILIANEVLDCEPRDQLVLTETGWVRRLVGLDGAGRLAFCDGEPAEGTTAHSARRVARIFPHARPGAVFEPSERHWSLDLLAGRSAAALYIDYGHVQPMLGDTLQAVRGHRFEHPLASPGEADLTMQVDFARHAAIAASQPEPLAVGGPVSQAEFLGALGIVERASRLMAANPDQAASIEAGVARLMQPTGMGGRFKVLGLRSRHLPALPGLPALDSPGASP
jgi:SAM-dependent MidA family methyltransferase